MKNITTFLLLVFLMPAWAQIPEWTWAKNANIYFNAEQYSVPDNDGNVYMVGTFSGTSVSLFGHTLQNSGEVEKADIYIIKFDPSGEVIYAKSFGGPKHDSVTAFTTDSEGNLYTIAGVVESLTIDSQTFTQDHGASIIAKFEPDGDLIWAKKLTTPGSPLGVTKMVTDASQNIYIAGSYHGWAPTTIGQVFLEYPNYDPAQSGSTRSFVAKLDSQADCLWAKGGTTTDTTVYLNLGTSLAVDAEGNVYTGGMFFSSDLIFDEVVITKSIPADGNGNMFVVKYDNNGNALWADGAGSQYLNQTSTLAISTAGTQAYVSGYFTNLVEFGSFPLQAVSGSNMFTVKYDADGTVLWVKKPFNSGGFNTIQSSDVDAQGNLYIAGTFSDNSLNFGNGVVITNPPAGDNGAFVVKYSADGATVWGKKVGQINANYLVAIDCVSQNELYMSGAFAAPTLTFGPITINKVPGTNYDAFISKLLYAPLSVDESQTDVFSTYPNPAKDILTLANLPEGTPYQVHDLLGKKILSGRVKASPERIDVESLQAGIYMLTVDLGLEKACRKIVVE